jgi:hypothetical protein
MQIGCLEGYNDISSREPNAFHGLKLKLGFFSSRRSSAIGSLSLPKFLRAGILI